MWVLLIPNILFDENVSKKINAILFIQFFLIRSLSKLAIGKPSGKMLSHSSQVPLGTIRTGSETQALHTCQCRHPIPKKVAALRTCRVAAQSGSSESDQGYVDLSYNGSDSRNKATIEHVWGPMQGKAPPPGLESPWELGWQVNERNLVWNDGLKVALIKRVAANELQLSDEEMDKRLEQLAVLLPGLVPRLMNAPPKLVAKAAVNVGVVAARLLELKQAFPQADILTMVNNRLSLLADDEYLSGQFSRVAERLGQLLPGMNVGAFVAEYPLVLDVDDFERAIGDVKMMGLDPVKMLRSNPSVVLAQVKGRHLIPYDQLENPFT
ncbi:hypothetical protein DUNSADRAFT_10349 [Dunaliella salina]|uniref:Uncharacterized protein n=1 Tax=Dunaliella salina TaxID=3046 RepID=A0ABQ7H4X4_DUNSA|nr:hypothetical protein DUNSADRAFT_10349 [Dunaliella salina]|eukprot:KAF5841912.1 hypothetical protein DUNSADRAFT_10349 [Dunaliella salina]